MNNNDTETLEKLLLHLLVEARAKEAKSQKYWYPLTTANYGIEEVMSAIDSMCSYQTTMGDKTKKFEKEFGNLIGNREAIMVNSGSSADLLIAFALVNPEMRLLLQEDEILVPAVTWPTQIWSAMMSGLKIRVVDTNPDTLNMDLDDLKDKILPRTRAISLVHLMGNPCDMDQIMDLCIKNGLVLIEDCCEALGAKFNGQSVGTFGMASSFSFFFSHHITTMEGGMVTCKNENLSDIIRLLRAHGWARNMKYRRPVRNRDVDPRYMFINWGFNLRPTELQAGFGLEQIKRLPLFNQYRLENVEYFMTYLKDHNNIMRSMRVHPSAECSWFALPIMLTKECPFTREEFVSYLEKDGVETRPIVTGNIASQPVSKMFPYLKGSNLNGAKEIQDRGFYIGVYPFKSNSLLNRLFLTFEKFIRART